jgi:hypothetical protein
MLKGKQTYNSVMHTKDLQIAQVGWPLARKQSARSPAAAQVETSQQQDGLAEM